MDVKFISEELGDYGSFSLRDVICDDSAKHVWM